MILGMFLYSGKEEILLPSGDEEDHNKNLEKEDLATKLDEVCIANLIL